MTTTRQARPKYQPQLFRSPINLPRRRRGAMAITHRIIPAGKEVSVIGMRQALLRGLRPTVATLTEDLRIHELRDENGIWMTDLPEELNQIAELIWTVQPKGRVLVGGLGLGILAHAMAHAGDVSSVMVVENSPDVIALCREPGYEIAEADIRSYLEVTTAPYDYYLLDTWRGTNESEWWDTVLPLRRAIRNRWGKKPVIHCWAEDIMQGQIGRSLITKEPHWYYQHLPVPMPVPMARAFMRDVGLPSWEKRWGTLIDQTYAEFDARRREWEEK